MKQKLFFLIALFLMAVTTSKASYSICPDTFEEEEHTHADLNEDGLCDECNSLCNLNALMQLEGVTATIVSNSTIPWTASNGTNCTPGIMAFPTMNKYDVSFMTIKLSSKSNFTLSFSYKTEVQTWYDVFRIFLDNSEALCDIHGEDSAGDVMTNELTAGEHTIQFYYEVGNNAHNSGIVRTYVYNIVAQSICQHEGDTSQASEVVAGTCGHSAYEVHTCSICGKTYNKDIADDQTYAHTDADNDGMCEVCHQFVNPEDLISTCGVDFAIENNAEYSWSVSTQEGCMPGLMATTTAESSITFSSTEPFTLSFSIKTLIPWVMINPKYWDEDPAGSLVITLDEEEIFWVCYTTEERSSKKLAAGTHTLTLTFEVDYPSSEPKGYVYDILVCNHTEDASLPTIIPATCTHGSYEIHTCSICGDTYETPEADDKIPHSYEKNAIPATCTHGSYEIHTCSVCGDTYNTPEADDKIPHSYEKNAIPATCTHGSYEIHTCSVCGDTYNTPEADDKIPHSDGNKNGDCDVCHTIMISSLVRLYKVTALYEATSPYPWLASTAEDYMPGLMIQDHDAIDNFEESTITFESEEAFTLSFSHIKFREYEHNDFRICVDNVEVTSYDMADGQVYNYSTELPAGKHILALSYRRFNFGAPDGSSRGYIYNIKALAYCDHSEDTSELDEVVPATCTHGSYEIHTCSVCGDTYNKPEADDTIDHLDSNNDGLCDECNAICNIAKFMTLRGVDANMSSDSDYPWINSNVSGFMPGLMSSNYGIHSSTSFSTITFTSTGDFRLSFEYAVSSETNYDWLTIILDDTAIDRISGSTTNSYLAVLEAGSHTLTIQYYKDDIVSDLLDCAFVYNISAQVLSLDEYTLVDATPYDFNFSVSNLTYERSINDAQVGKWQALYVPFQMTYEDWKDDFDVAAINNFHEYIDAEGNIDRIELEVRYIKNSTLMANHPYLIRPKSAGKKSIELKDVVLAEPISNSISCSSVERKYTFTGTYQPITQLNEKGYTFLSNGNLSQTDNADIVLSPQRWYLTIENLGNQWEDEPTGSAETKLINIRIMGEENEDTNIEDIYVISSPLEEGYAGNAAIYDLLGRHTSVVSRGLNIIRTEDGKADKVMIK